jgi:hypothetical protein
VAAATTLGGCGAGSSGTSPGPSGSPSSPTPSNLFEPADQQIGKLMTEQAQWQAPEFLTVDRSQRIGLTIGESEALHSKVSQLVDQAVPKAAGPVQVGPTVRVTLQADPNDADITPSVAVDESTGSHVALLWTWMVRPKRPSQGLQLTAHVEVPSSGYNFTTDLGIAIPVKRTWQYTLKQVATSWQAIFGTGIGASAIVVTAWVAKRRRRKANESVTPTASDPDPQLENATPRG